MTKLYSQEQINQEINKVYEEKQHLDSLTEQNQLLKNFYNKICNSSSKHIVKEINYAYPYTNLIKAQICEDSINFCAWFQSRIMTKSQSYVDMSILYHDYCTYYKEEKNYKIWLKKFRLYFSHIEIFEIGDKYFICGEFKTDNLASIEKK